MNHKCKCGGHWRPLGNVTFMVATCSVCQHGGPVWDEIVWPKINVGDKIRVMIGKVTIPAVITDLHGEKGQSVSVNSEFLFGRKGAFPRYQIDTENQQ